MPEYSPFHYCITFFHLQVELNVAKSNLAKANVKVKVADKELLVAKRNLEEAHLKAKVVDEELNAANAKCLAAELQNQQLGSMLQLIGNHDKEALAKELAQTKVVCCKLFFFFRLPYDKCVFRWSLLT